MNQKKGLYALLILLMAIIAYKYSVHPVVLKTLFPEKIWSHRVNSLMKLEEASKYYKGVELDIVWENYSFDINHPPAESINLSLAEYLSFLPNAIQDNLWLDYKNLNEENAITSARYLDSLTRHYNINKINVYVESNAPQYLIEFQKRGFKTSYYLPSGLNGLEANNVPVVKKDIKSKLNGNSDMFISAPFADYSFIRKHFPERKKLLWHLGGLTGPFNKLNIYRALLDNNVKVVLFPYKSELGDR